MTTAKRAELCRMLGVQPRYFDQAGNSHEAAASTIEAMLRDLGFPAGDEGEAAASLEALARGPVGRFAPATVVLRAAEANPAVPLALPEAVEDAIEWRIELEDGRVQSGKCRISELPAERTGTADGGGRERRSLPLPPGLPLGYHRLELRLRGSALPASITRLVLAPGRAWMPPQLDAGPGVWGVALQLYSLRSARNWGIGDFTDLAEAVRLAAAAGADFIGLNPLHALHPDDPAQASPYSPSSRRFLNTLYIDPEAVAEFAGLEPAERGRALALKTALRDGPLIDYRAAAGAKTEAFEALFRLFVRLHLERDSPRAAEFRRFRDARGPALARFATFQALREQLGRSDPRLRDWRRWPPAYRNVASPEVAAFAARARARVAFFEYLQWQAELQLAAAAAAAREAGMAIGLYLDLAVGVDAGGAESWALPEELVQGWSIGAPPDAWNLKGQAWGLVPFHPLALAESGYAAFIDTLRANMCHAGALRIDHVLGWRRLFWVQEGRGPADGLYLHYPFADLAGIAALESHRNRCLIVGEDLGTLPEGLQAALQAAGILSYRLLLFGRGPDGAFDPPAQYPRLSAVAVSTHDLPTFRAWWEERDIELRAALDLYPVPETMAEDRRERPRARRLLSEALGREGLLDTDAPETPPLDAAYRFLARTPARLVVLQAEDMLDLRDQVNVPGTTVEHPNWHRRLPVPVESMFDGPAVRRVLAALAAERPARRGRP